MTLTMNFKSPIVLVVAGFLLGIITNALLLLCLIVPNVMVKDTSPDPSWECWKEGSMFAFGFPDKNIPSIYKMAGRGALYNDGMFVAQCGPNTRWNQQNFPHGGHVFEGWDVDRKGRITLLVMEPNSEQIAQYGDFDADGLKRAGIQIFDYTAKRFGWLKVGSDSRNDWMGGWDFTDTWVKAHTPVSFRPQKKPEFMPSADGYTPPAVHDGSFYVDIEDGIPRIYVHGRWRKFVLSDD